MDLIIESHICKRITCYDPENTAALVLLDPHDDIRHKAVARIKHDRTQTVYDAQTAAVRTGDYVAVSVLTNCKHFCIAHA